MDIVFEDEDIIVINKKSGVLVHPDKYTKDGTMVDFLLGYYPKIKDVGEGLRPGIVHRLDKDTSGLIVCAKNQVIFDNLREQFQNKKVIKKYKTLVHGIVKEKSGIITYAISKKGRSQKLSATTRYKVVEYFRNYTLLNVEIETGRMHQIRQHMKKIGHPIVGDREYTFKNLKEPYPLNRLFLHSYYLKIEVRGEKKEFEIELPNDLKKYLEQLKNDYNNRGTGR